MPPATAICRLFTSIALIAGLVAPLRLHAQATGAIPGYVERRWTSADGLPQNMIPALTQTRDGYLWIGTANAGLVRFDGVAFTTFDILNTPGLPANGITALREDAAGTLWIGTGGGLARYRDGIVTPEPFAGNTERPPVVDIESDPTGNLWAVTRHSLAQRVGDRWVTTPLGDVQVECLERARDGSLWIGARDRLIQWRDGRAVRTIAASEGLPAGVRALYEDRARRLWIGTMHGLAFLAADGAVVRAEEPALKAAAVTGLLEDRDGTLWVGGVGRLFARAPDGELSTPWFDASGTEGQVSALTQDSEGHVWVGRHGGTGGLQRLSPARVTTLSRKDGLPCDNVGPVAEAPDGTIWIATLCNSGRGIVALRDGHVTEYGGPVNTASLLAEADGVVWAGTYQGELFRRDGGTRRFLPVRLPVAPPRGAVNVIHRAGDGSLWLGTNNGLVRHHDGQWTSLSTHDGLVDDLVVSIAQGHDGALWIGTRAGVSRYAGGRFVNFTAANGLPRGRVRAVHADADGIVWIGTYGGGLARLKDGKLTAYGTLGGMLDTSVHRIIEDLSGFLWLTGDHGVRRVSRQELNDVAEGRSTAPGVVLYDESNGMRSAECNGMGHPAGCRTSDGRLLIPTQLGIARIDPSHASEVVPPAPVPQIEAVAVDGTLHLPTADLVVPPGSHDVEVRYTAPTFTQPRHVQFRHRLDGFDDTWMEAGVRRVAHYANLPPGTYRFRVAARSPGGAWREEAATVAFTLKPHFYQRLPYQVALGALLLAAIVMGVRLRLVGLRQRARALETTVAERTAEVARQRDEVRAAHDRLASAHESLAGAKRDVEHAHGQVLAVLNQLDVGVLVLNADATVRYVSESATRLLGSRAVVGRPWNACLPLGAADAARVDARVAASRADAGAGRIPVQLELAGKRFWMEIDVRDEPSPGTGRIMYLCDAAELSAVGTRSVPRGGAYELVGQSTPMHLLYKQIRDVARVDVTVLIEGETGTGKELVARAIHRGSNRSTKPFIAVNTAGLAESLLASQLFGHRRGAFTGAVADQMGVFESANGGTVFLDEVGDIPHSVQVSLLRVLQEREITRIGESVARRLDVRFLAATHRDLAREVAEGRFRQDLFYRLRVTAIRVPALRERTDDVPLLVGAFVGQAARRSGRAAPEVGSDTLALLMQAPWPGNVRELKSAVEHAVLTSTGPVLRPVDLPVEFAAFATTADPSVPPDERERIVDALRRAQGNRSEAARLLGIGRSTFYRKLALHGLSDA